MQRRQPVDPATAAVLAARRRKAGLTQNALALALGLSEATISKIETARVPISPETLARIERAIESLAGTGGSAAQ